MTREEAIRILNPETTVEALAEIEYFAGFRGLDAQLEAMKEACRTVIEALQERPKGRWELTVLKHPDSTTSIGAPHCTLCKRRSQRRTPFCPYCGADMRESE